VSGSSSDVWDLYVEAWFQHKSAILTSQNSYVRNSPRMSDQSAAALLLARLHAVT